MSAKLKKGQINPWVSLTIAIAMIGGVALWITIDSHQQTQIDSEEAERKTEEFKAINQLKSELNIK